MRIEVLAKVDRPVADVFHWYADDHVRNHPRWDPDMELQRVTPGPIAVGTVIRRRNTHFDNPLEGTMEVVEYDPNQAFGVVIRDGPQETRGRVTFQENEQNQTILGIAAEFQGMDESKRPLVTSLMERSARNIKEPSSQISEARSRNFDPLLPPGLVICWLRQGTLVDPRPPWRAVRCNSGSA